MKIKGQYLFNIGDNPAQCKVLSDIIRTNLMCHTRVEKKKKKKPVLIFHTDGYKVHRSSFHALVSDYLWTYYAPCSIGYSCLWCSAKGLFISNSINCKKNMFSIINCFMTINTLQHPEFSIATRYATPNIVVLNIKTMLITG